MRKVLLASTALCMGAGMAMAEIALTGAAEMGVAGSKDDSTRFHTDVNVKFSMSGETDGGIAFGTAIELAESGDGSNAVDDDDEHGGISVYMKGPFGNLELGDTNGAYAYALADARGVGGGAIRDDHEHDGSSGNDGLDGKHDGQILRYDIAFSGFGFAASVELDDDIDDAKPDEDPLQKDDGDPIFGVGGKYSMTMADGMAVGVGVGYQMGSSATEDMTVIGGSVDVTTPYGLKAVANFSNESHEASAANDSSKTDVTYAGFGLGYAAGPMSIGVNVGTIETDDSDNSMDKDVTGFGLAASYSLGGGAELQFGVGSSETDYADAAKTDTDANQWSLGVAFSF